MQEYMLQLDEGLMPTFLRKKSVDSYQPII
jgi:hypothetical protein